MKLYRFSSNGRPVRWASWEEMLDLASMAIYMGATIEARNAQGTEWIDLTSFVKEELL